MTHPAGNMTVKDRIRAYWSARAATFDDDAGHKIEPTREAPLWRALITRALGPVEGCDVLDLACGTGEISQQLLDLGARVTGVDFAEPMLARAQAKLTGRDWCGVLDDAELLASQPDTSFDAVVARHLVWTLPDPDAAFRAWARVLRPGGRLLIVDGDWRHSRYPRRVLRDLADWLDPPEARGGALDDYRDLLDALKHRGGPSRTEVATELRNNGFQAIRPLSVRTIYGRGMVHAPLARRLRLRASARFALAAEKTEVRQNWVGFGPICGT